jgi:branched-subunit amino acid transport protein
MNLWLVMIAGGALTFAIRLSFIALLGRMQVPPLLQRALRLVPPAVLSAIIFQELFLSDGKINFSLANPRLIAGLLAGVVAWRTRSPLLSILAGMVGLLVLQTLFNYF